MTNRIKGSQGWHFNLGATRVYVGPRDKLPNDRHLKMPPVIAIQRLGDKDPTIVGETGPITVGQVEGMLVAGELKNSTMAELLIEVLIQGMEEDRGLKIGGRTPCGSPNEVKTPVGDLSMVCDLDLGHEATGRDHEGNFMGPDGNIQRASWPVSVVVRS